MQLAGAVIGFVFAGKQHHKKALCVDRHIGKRPFVGLVFVVGQCEALQRNGGFFGVIKLHPRAEIAVGSQERLGFGRAVFVEADGRFGRFGFRYRHRLFHRQNNAAVVGCAGRRAVEHRRFAVRAEAEALVAAQARHMQHADEVGFVVKQPQRFTVLADGKRQMEHPCSRIDAARFVGEEHQILTGLQRISGKDEGFGLCGVVGQRPAGKVHRAVGRVIQLDPVAIGAGLVGKDAVVAAHRFVDTDGRGRLHGARSARKQRQRRQKQRGKKCQSSLHAVSPSCVFQSMFVLEFRCRYSRTRPAPCAAVRRTDTPAS